MLNEPVREHMPADPMSLAGVATVDITPTGSVEMSGFVARDAQSTGSHDSLFVRALVVERTAVITVDVVGLHEDFCSRVRFATSEFVDYVIVHATHMHSGPASIPGRLGGP